MDRLGSLPLEQQQAVLSALSVLEQAGVQRVDNVSSLRNSLAQGLGDSATPSSINRVVEGTGAWRMCSRDQNDDPSAVRMRFCHINDVYTLENLPKLRTLLVDAASGLPPNNLVVTIGGDLLSPYPLSALDKGRGMVDVLLKCGVRFCCFGNHEADVGLTALRLRIEQWRQGCGVWLNTNMPDLLPELALPTHAPIVGYSHDGNSARHISLLGVCTGEAALYPPPYDFGGAYRTAEDCNTCALTTARRLMESGVQGAEEPTDAPSDVTTTDAIVVLTHQDTAPDRELARQGWDAGIAVVLGGHDHEEYLEQHNKCVMAKSGSDARKVVIVDLLWPSSEHKGMPLVDHMELMPVADWTPSKPVAKAADGHMKKINDMEKLKGAMALTYFEADPLVSSKGIRKRQTTMGTIICNALRQEMDVDCVLFDGGNIRGSKEYLPVESHHHGPKWAFTMADLDLELPYPSKMGHIQMCGEEIAEAVRFSRNHLPALFGGFLQFDDGLETDAADQKVVTHVAGEPLEPKRLYNVGLMLNSLNGMNNNPAFEAWRRNTAKNVVPPDDVGIPAKVLLIRHFALASWRDMPDFSTMDTNQDGCLSSEEIYAAYKNAYPNSGDEVIQAAVTRLLDAVDYEGDGVVSREEYESVCFPLPRWTTLTTLTESPLISSRGVRECQTTMGHLICDALRSELLSDCVLFDGGNIRGDREYKPIPGHRRGPKWHFTLADLRRELPWASEMVVVDMTGAEIAEAVRWSRSQPSGFGGFLQTDSALQVAADNHTRVTHVLGLPVDSEREYRVALIHSSLYGMNRNPVFQAWLAARPGEKPSPGSKATTLLMNHFVRTIWARMPDFDDIEAAHEGALSWEHFKDTVRKVFFEDATRADGLTRRLLLMAKLDAKGQIVREEYEHQREMSVLCLDSSNSPLRMVSSVGQML